MGVGGPLQFWDANAKELDTGVDPGEDVLKLSADDISLSSSSLMCSIHKSFRFIGLFKEYKELAIGGLQGPCIDPVLVTLDGEARLVISG